MAFKTSASDQTFGSFDGLPAAKVRQKVRHFDAQDASRSTRIADVQAHFQTSGADDRRSVDVLSEPGAVDRAAASLKQIVLDSSTEDTAWLACARTLRTAMKERLYHDPHMAGVLLILADALTFTDPASVDGKQLRALSKSLVVLTSPRAERDDEANAFETLLKAGWELTASHSEDDVEAFVARYS